jgi:hypothetical protein
LAAQAKRYPLNQSPLYRIQGKEKFKRALGLDWDAIPSLLSSPGYRTWQTKGEKPRDIQAPINWMNAVHGRLAKLLSRIEVPDYVFSQKGRSYADNAHQHVGRHPVIKTDIHRFYPSVSRAMVFRMFREDFCCAEDVAHHLADICCFQQKHLPTGSPLSGRVAFFAARPLFEEIRRLADAHGCKLTIYVDDISLSGPKATRKLLGEVRELISRHGLKTTERKSKSFSPNAAKSVTGVVIVGSELRLPNERHKKMHEARLALRTADTTEKQALKRQLNGREQEAAQVLRLNDNKTLLGAQTGAPSQSELSCPENAYLSCSSTAKAGRRRI